MDDQVAERNVLDGQSVTSLGNSWIICRSKSHSGRIYYFNTFTGEAAWNLSDNEIEKAKKTTKILQSQSGGELEGCPEPKEPPMDICPGISKDSKSNDSFLAKSKQTFEACTHCCSCVSHITQTAVNGVGVPVPGPHNCKANYGAVPHNHQIVKAPSIPATTVKQSPDEVSKPFDYMDQQISVQNTSLPLSRRFNFMQETRPNRNIFKHGVNKSFHANNYSESFSQQKGSILYNKQVDHNDLRQKLAAKRSYNRIKSTENVNYGDGVNTVIKNRTCIQKIQIIKPELEALSPSKGDDEWIKENASVKGTNLVLNVDPLKELVTSEEQCTTWYVVADTNVLLNNINLINIIVQSDDQCKLMVPDYIMAELQKTSLYNVTLMSRAHNVLQLLSKQFAAGAAVMGKDPSSDFDKLMIYDFCSKLCEQDHNVVLVSNNIQLEKYMNTAKFPILTISDLKELLNRRKILKPTPEIARSLKDIKITIPNNNDFVTKSEETQFHEHMPQSGNAQFKITQNNMSTQTNKEITRVGVTYNIKTFVDIGVQTDPIFSDELFTQKVDKSTATDNSFASSSSDNDVKKSGNQLKRHLSNQTSVESGEKKQFKWRRRKRIQSATNEDILEKSTINQNALLKEDTEKHDQTNNHNMRSIDMLNYESKSTIYDEPNDGSETGSSCYIQHKPLDKIIIEETSTSGISNTASNIGTESTSSMKLNEQIIFKNVNDEQNKCKCAMFEVKNSAMEEYLKMKSDEWLSRFVQIMEEVLTQTLQRDPSLFNRMLPPPWTIHEATECIIKKFCHDSDVTDAANKLLSVLYKISDGRGQFRRELKPVEFMEMYSYGVYLVDSLQTLHSNCEDLEMAADSLAKLLSDIEDPNLDTGHVDCFMEISDVSEANVTQLALDNTQNQSSDPVKTQTREELWANQKSPLSLGDNTTSNQNKYNLRSAVKQIIKDNDNQEKVVKFIRNIDVESTFFSSLNLQKRNGINMSDYSKQIVLSHKENKSPSKDNNSNKTDQNPANEPKDNTVKNEPKIIRNFSKCIEFEKKIKGANHFEESSYYEEPEDGEIQEYDEYYDDDYNYDYDYYENAEEDVQNDDSDYIDQIIGKLVNEIQEAFIEVHSFCDKTKAELISMPNLSSPRKIEIRDKAEKARLHMNVLCKTLNSIISREDTDCKNNLQAVLKDAGIHLDTAKLDEYRNIVSKYKQQANILLEAVNVVIEAVD